tara:strand:- start:403 stop:594 length:192 start_codon:yes stop_codon:yes gene_type:complete
LISSKSILFCDFVAALFLLQWLFIANPHAAHYRKMLNSNPAITIITDNKIRRRWLAVLGEAQL